MSSEYIKTAEYLAALNPAACGEYCKIRGLAIETILPTEFTEPSQVMDCMQTFMLEGISLQYVFMAPSVWEIYLKSVVEERFHTGMALMLQSGNPANIIYFFRACYRFGSPAIKDQDFDALEQMYIQAFPSLEFFNQQTYDDDQYPPIVLDALRMSGSKSTRSGAIGSRFGGNHSKEYDDLNTEKSTSIRPVIMPEEAFEFWRDAPVCRVHFSLKIDGVNTKMTFSAEEGKGLELALSRGRSADSIDYTEAIRRVFATQQVDDTKLSGRVTGESFVPLSALSIIQQKYADKDYKTPKSTAMAMIRAADKFSVEDYQYLSFYAFDYAGMKPDVAFAKLNELGIHTPPALEFAGEEIPRDSLEHFNQWMETNVLDPLWKAGEELGIGSDGVVMFLLADINTERRDKYSDSNIAIKYSHWSAAIYRAKVEQIIFEQKRVEASIVLGIEPTVMRDKNTATRVGIGSPDILIKDDVRVGDTIEFTRKSEAYNVYLRKVPAV